MPAEAWAVKIGPLFTWKGNTWNAGTNVTPTTDGERVYVLGGFGDLLCVEAASGIVRSPAQRRDRLPRRPRQPQRPSS